MADLIVPAYNETTREQCANSDGQAICSLMIYVGTASDDGTFSLGGSIMCSMYTVFDLDNSQISIAQAVVINQTSGGGFSPVQAGPGGVSSAAGDSDILTAASNTGIISGLGYTFPFSYKVVTTKVGAAVDAAATPEAAEPSGSVGLEAGISSTIVVTTRILRAATTTLDVSLSTSSPNVAAIATSASKARAAVGNGPPSRWVLMCTEMAVAVVSGLGALLAL